MSSPDEPMRLPVPTLPGLRQRLLRRFVARLEQGRLVVETPDGEEIERQGPRPGPEARLVLHRWRPLRRLVLEGEIGLAESYMDGDWSSPALERLIELAALNEPALRQRLGGSPLARWLSRLSHLARANTRRGSRRNIMAHYDLGNDFYAAWLDRGMSYSSALYGAAQTLDAAQEAKLDRVSTLLGLAGGERVLEIGCGWGALAERLVRRHGSRLTAITLSPAQRAHAAARLAGAAEVRLQDYRDLTGTYDRIVSIEMLEAVGRAYWPGFFRILHDRLAPGGIAVLQVITIAADRFEHYCRTPDFIQRHVFPGGMLPSVPALLAEIGRAGLVLRHAEHFGASYARTLADWQRRFQQAWPALEAQGFGRRFKRLWEYYLAYCEGGFRAGAIDVGLYRIERPAQASLRQS